MLAVYLVFKWVEIFQIALMSNRSLPRKLTGFSSMMDISGKAERLEDFGSARTCMAIRPEALPMGMRWDSSHEVPLHL